MGEPDVLSYDGLQHTMARLVGGRTRNHFHLTSDVSRSFPIPDAGLGAVAYMVEFLMGFIGDKRRWRTMPWMVTFFGILVVPLGVVSVTLIILQPLAVGARCHPASSPPPC